MKRSIWIGIALFVLLYFTYSRTAFSWDNERTHRDLSKYAAETSALSKDKGDYLKKIGFDNGLEDMFKWGEIKRTVEDWIAEGADFEDAGTKLQAVAGKARFNNHFHDPTKEWNNAGLTDRFK